MKNESIQPRRNFIKKMAATSGNAFCGGMLITPALSFGRMLGRKLGQKF